MVKSRLRSTFAKILEESDAEDEEDNDFRLYLSDDENFEDLLPDNNSTEEDTETTQSVQGEEDTPRGSQIAERAIVHNPDNSNYNWI